MAQVLLVELPEELALLLEEDPVLRILVKRVAEKSIREYLIKLLALDKLAEGSKLTMDDVLEVDGLVKKGIAERLRKRETSHRHE